MRQKRYMVFNFRKLLPLRRGRQTWLEAIISIRNLNYMVFSKPAKLLVFIYSDVQYFMRVSAILRTLVRLLFYALRRAYYFMRFSAILCQGNFRHLQASTR